MRNVVCTLLVCLWTAMTGVVLAAADPLADGFASPPASAWPWVYWFWKNGNISRAGITADLEAMHRVGIRGVILMEVALNVPPGLQAGATGPRPVPSVRPVHGPPPLSGPAFRPVRQGQTHMCQQ